MGYYATQADGGNFAENVISAATAGEPEPIPQPLGSFAPPPRHRLSDSSASNSSDSSSDSTSDSSASEQSTVKGTKGAGAKRARAPVDLEMDEECDGGLDVLCRMVKRMSYGDLAQDDQRDAVMLETPSGAADASTAAAPVAAAAVLSASVISAEPLMLGIEANEDDSARGDVTQAFADAVTSTGARQVFRFGRMILNISPTGLDVPACVKVRIANDGAAQWPELTALAIVFGEAYGCHDVAVGPVPKDETVDLEIDLAVPVASQPGAARSIWALVDTATGARLGPLLCFEVVHVQ